MGKRKRREYRQTTTDAASCTNFCVNICSTVFRTGVQQCINDCLACSGQSERVIFMTDPDLLDDDC